MQHRLGHAAIAIAMWHATYSPPVVSTHHQFAFQGLGLA